MQQLFALSVLILNSCGFAKSGADITLNLNINTNTDKGKSEKESVLLVRDNGNRRALGRSLKRKINIYRNKIASFCNNTFSILHLLIDTSQICQIFPACPCRDSCNICSCTPDGAIVTSTKMLCLPIHNPSTISSKIPLNRCS